MSNLGKKLTLDTDMGVAYINAPQCLLQRGDAPGDACAAITQRQATLGHPRLSEAIYS